MISPTYTSYSSTPSQPVQFRMGRFSTIWKVSKVVRLENRQKTCCRRLKSILEKKIGGVGCLPSPLEPLEFAKNSEFWARLKASRGERKHPTLQFFFL